jgi:hypothetical protein
MGSMMAMQPGSGLQLLSTEVGLAGVAVFVAIAASHLRHLARTTGQRRGWHACHVLMALGMAFMYLPASFDPVAIPSTLWRALFAVAGALAALWAITAVQRAPTSMWLLTAVDLAAMSGMWSAGLSRPLTWLLAAYFTAQAVLWSADGYRRIDGGRPLVRWSVLDADGGGGAMTVGARRVATAREALIGEIDITVSMFAMTVATAFMCVAMAVGR